MIPESSRKQSRPSVPLLPGPGAVKTDLPDVDLKSIGNPHVKQTSFPTNKENTNEMINWGAFQTLPSFAPIRHTISAAGYDDVLTDKFLTEPGINPDELRTGIRAEWETAGCDPKLAKKIAISNIKQDRKYYSGLDKYTADLREIAIDNEAVFTEAELLRFALGKNIDPQDLLAGLNAEKLGGACLRKAGLKALGNITNKPGFYNGHDTKQKQPVIYGDYTPIGNTKGNTIAYNDTKPFSGSESEPISSELNENSHSNPLGMIETWKFFQMADDSNIAELNNLLQRGNYAKAWAFIRDTTEAPDPAVDKVNQEVKATSNTNQLMKLAENQLEGSAASGTASSDIDPAELAMGITVEMEHTDDNNLAAEIAADHLKKDGNYYTKLQRAGLADECAPALSSGLGDATHPINKEFRIGEDATPTAGNNKIGSSGNTPPMSTIGKHDYKELPINLRQFVSPVKKPSGQNPGKGAFMETTDLYKNDPKMVGKWTINAFPVDGKDYTPRMKLREALNFSTHFEHDEALFALQTARKKGEIDFDKLLNIALQYIKDVQTAEKVVEHFMNHYNLSETKEVAVPKVNAVAMSDLHKIEKYAGKLKHMIANDPKLDDAVKAKLAVAGETMDSIYHFLDGGVLPDKDSQTNEENIKGNDALKGKTNIPASELSYKQKVELGFYDNKDDKSKKSTNENENGGDLNPNNPPDLRKKIGEVVPPELKKANIGYNWWTEDSHVQVEGVGKMSVRNIKETVVRTMEKLCNLAECGDYDALTKNTTNGQMSVLESIKTAVQLQNESFKKQNIASAIQETIQEKKNRTIKGMRLQDCMGVIDLR